jgi:hypothetical protein
LHARGVGALAQRLAAPPLLDRQGVWLSEAMIRYVQPRQLGVLDAQAIVSGDRVGEKRREALRTEVAAVADPGAGADHRQREARHRVGQVQRGVAAPVGARLRRWGVGAIGHRHRHQVTGQRRRRVIAQDRPGDERARRRQAQARLGAAEDLGLDGGDRRVGVEHDAVALERERPLGQIAHLGGTAQDHAGASDVGQVEDPLGPPAEVQVVEPGVDARRQDLGLSVGAPHQDRSIACVRVGAALAVGHCPHRHARHAEAFGRQDLFGTPGALAVAIGPHGQQHRVALAVLERADDVAAAGDVVSVEEGRELVGRQVLIESAGKAVRPREVALGVADEHPEVGRGRLSCRLHQPARQVDRDRDPRVAQLLGRWQVRQPDRCRRRELRFPSRIEDHRQKQQPVAMTAGQLDQLAHRRAQRRDLVEGAAIEQHHHHPLHRIDRWCLRELGHALDHRRARELGHDLDQRSTEVHRDPDPGLADRVVVAVGRPREIDVARQIAVQPEDVGP